MRITAHKTFRELRGNIDTLLVAGGSAIENDEVNAEVIRWLKTIAGRIRRIGSVCTGAMLLARAGLLDGRRATTHWNWCEVLIRRAPRTQVDRDPIFVRDKNVYTSAGVTAGMDLALALVEEDHGSRLALQVARNLVLYLRRPGGQSQFSAALSLQLTDRKPLRELESWVLDNLNKPLTRAGAGQTRGHESAKFRADLHQGNENHAGEIRRTSSSRDRSAAPGRKPEQHGVDRKRVRFRKCEFNAQRFSARVKDCARTVSSPLPPRETSTKVREIRSGGRRSDRKSHSQCVLMGRYHLEFGCEFHACIENRQANLLADGRI